MHEEDDELRRRLASVLGIGGDPGRANTWEFFGEVHSLLKDERLRVEGTEPARCSWPLRELAEEYRRLSASRPRLVQEGEEAAEPVVIKDPVPLNVDHLSLIFAQSIRSGQYPPPGAMWGVMRCFEAYYRAGGRMSLDEAFFGEKHKINSNPAGRFLKNADYRSFLYAIINARREASERGEPRPTRAKVAELYLEASSNDAVEAFLKGYSRWLKSIREKHGGLEETQLPE